VPDPRTDTDPAVVVLDVSKRFRLSGHRTREFKTALLHPLRSLRGSGRPEPFWALDGISFEVAKGESLGIIGANGSGKSTLLRILAGITPPSTGSVSITGRVAALLELGAGFHPMISGRDNAILNAVLLGLSMHEAQERLDDVIAFAGMEEFIDEPMRTYSFGMYLRLGFAVAVHVQPEVLLVDEVLAVGDAEFQLKCFDHIEELRRRGVTIIIVSHDLPQVERFTDRVILLEKGRIVADGLPNSVVGLYRSQTAAAT
jgi:ABC-type polysaccharide/polyol phosphate transport system ATPase subunit